MKDYLLSEIKNHDWNEDWQVSDDDAKGYKEEEFLRRLKRDLDNFDIEPRDMIDLPCKIKVEAEPYKWQAIWRGSYRIFTVECYTESEADAFLAGLKGGKK